MKTKNLKLNFDKLIDAKLGDVFELRDFVEVGNLNEGLWEFIFLGYCMTSSNIFNAIVLKEEDGDFTQELTDGLYMTRHKKDPPKHLVDLKRKLWDLLLEDKKILVSFRNRDGETHGMFTRYIKRMQKAHGENFFLEIFKKEVGHLFPLKFEKLGEKNEI